MINECDLLVVGTGAAGLTAAIAAADKGLRVVVIESTRKWGGTTALSGGGLWMPTNPLVPGDSLEAALTYLEASVGDAGPASSPERRKAFVTTVPEVYRLLERLGARWTRAARYPDHYPDRPGGMIGRGIEVEPFDIRRLGEWQATFRGRDSLPAPVQRRALEAIFVEQDPDLTDLERASVQLPIQSVATNAEDQKPQPKIAEPDVSLTSRDRSVTDVLRPNMAPAPPHGHDPRSDLGLRDPSTATRP